MTRLKLSNSQIAKAVIEVIPTLSHRKVLDEIDIGRNPQQEKLFVNSSLVNDYIAGYKEKLEAQNGSVSFEGKKYIITDQAYCDNYGTDGEVRYYAHAIDEDNTGNSYKVTWQTTLKWDRSCELARMEEAANYSNDFTAAEDERFLELKEMTLCDIEDESNACDWDSPINVELI